MSQHTPDEQRAVEPQREDIYEPPTVEDVENPDGRAVTSAGFDQSPL